MSLSPATPPELCLVIGGYSYGSLVATRLPAPDLILARFTQPVRGTTAAEIRLRAAHRATEWNDDARRLRGAGTIHGGEECAPGARRPSHEGHRRSAEILLRRSLDRSREKLGLGTPDRSNGEQTSREKAAERLEAITVPVPHVAYLLVSPLLPPTSLFLTMFARHAHEKGKPGDHESEHDDRLAKGPTLAVYGGDDLFTAVKKLRKWSAATAESPGACFQSVEIPRAGHFWHDVDAQRRLAEAVKSWACSISNG